MEADVKDFVKDHSVGIISTCDNNEPHGVPVYYYFDGDKFYFATKSKTKKIENIESNGNVFLMIYREEPQAVFTAKCKATLMDYKDSGCMGIVKHLVGVHASQDYYPTPLTALKEGNITVVELEVREHQFKSYK